MPNTKSAIKAARQNISRRKINLKIDDKIKRSIKDLRKAVTAGKADETKKAIQNAYSALDKAVKKNWIHKNAASRKKSRLAKMVARSASK
ncbi:MAG: 30S ribosomal protein S20 [Acidobacteriaceae bacterium]